MKIIKHFLKPKSHLIFAKSFLNKTEYINNDSAIKLAVSWLFNIQKKGFPSKYSILHGVTNDFPETTGYIIPTLLNFNLEKTEQAGEWLLEVQHEDGAFGTDADLKDKKIFDTAQTIFGTLALYQKTNKDKYLQSAIKAGNFIIQNQEENGSWVKYAFNDIPHSYYSRVAYALLNLYEQTNNEKYKQSAIKNLDWVLSNQQENGFFKYFSFDKNEKAPLHTIAYTIEGLLKSGLILNEQKYIDAAKKTADSFLNKELFSFYNSDWSHDNEKCLTGMAQMAIIFLIFYAANKKVKYLDNARKINKYLKKRQMQSGAEEIKGAIPGSYPISGKYMPYSYPNWAAKFFIDSLLLENKFQEDNLSIAIFSNDPIESYLSKGELRKNYWNPDNLFKKIYVINNSDYKFTEENIKKISFMSGDAELQIVPIKDAKEFFEKNSIDFVRTYGLYQPGLLACLLSKKHNIPFIISLHTNYDDYRIRVFEDKQYLKWIKQTAWKYMFELNIVKAANKILAVYNFATLYPLEYGVSKDKIHVIYNKVSSDLFKKMDIEKYDKFTVANVNTMIPGKNQEALIRAIQGTDYNLLLIGQGPNKDFLINLTKELKVEDQVKFIAKVDNAELPKYYNKCHAYASVSKYGGIGIGTIESMACGLPIIHTKHAWEKEPEYLGYDNCVFTENNPKAMKEAMDKLQDKEYWNKMSDISLKAYDRISDKAATKKEKEFYLDIL